MNTMANRVDHPPIYTSWHTPATALPRKRVGGFRIVDHTYTRGYYMMWGLLDASLFYVKRKINITGLQEFRGRKWHTWMVDDPPHWEAMKFYAQEAHGRVLCGGLGLGLIQHALGNSALVKSVTTVERSRDVIALVGSTIPAGQQVVQGDFFTVLDGAFGEDWDTVIADLWVADGAEQKFQIYPEVLSFAFQLRQLLPHCKLFTHGFPSLCDSLWPMSERTQESLRFLAEEPSS